MRESTPNRVTHVLLAQIVSPQMECTFALALDANTYLHGSNHHPSSCLHSWEVVNSIFLKIKEVSALGTRGGPV